MSNKLDDLEEEVLDELLPYLTEELQKSARASGWPLDVAAGLSVESANHDIEITYPGRLESQIQELEYGNGIMPPRAVLRPFIGRFSPKATEKMADTTLWMFMEGEL